MLLFQLPGLAKAAVILLAAATTMAEGKIARHAAAEKRTYPTSAIQWQPCPADINTVAALDVECGVLTVPLDYTAPHSNETLDLSLVRVPALKKPAKHSILLNFGGPGAEARHALAELSDMLQVVTGGEHDLITWDPRGTAETLTFSCFDNTTIRTQFTSQLGLGNASDVQRGVIWAAGKNYADACANYPDAQKKAPIINTAFTARDAMQIVDAVEEDRLLRYWGFSYGTDLGATLAALFPERAEKVLLDGVYTPNQYFYERTDSQGFASADDTFSEFFRQCVATPEVCSLARSHPNATAKQLESAAYDLIEELKYRPIPYNGAILGYSELKIAIRFGLYAPGTWLEIDSILNAFLTEPRNETLAGETLGGYISLSLAAPVDDAGIGIECVDKAPRSNSFDVISASIDEAQAVSRLLGDSLAALIATCAQWTLEPRERYMDGFAKVKPLKPLFVIGNTYDSATSIKSARNFTETVKGSVLLEHGGVGHASIAQPSLCTARAIQAFFTNGTLPEPNTVCKTVTTPFKYAKFGPTWQDLFPQLGYELPKSNQTQAARARPRDSTEEAIKKLSRRSRGVVS
ncbi:TAP-like protein-domain-containing protein [Nemania sp. FL0916]|nr:TAP-like protein-domain-containing protein [Nemania sp. FL0916]